MGRICGPEQVSNRFSYSGSIEFVLRQPWGISKGTTFGDAVEQALFVESVQSRHDRGVGDGNFASLENIADSSAAPFPEYPQ